MTGTPESALTRRPSIKSAKGKRRQERLRFGEVVLTRKRTQAIHPRAPELERSEQRERDRGNRLT